MTNRNDIIKHVSQMILSLGVKSVRMDDVASDMGMSKRTLYEMFGDKEELLFESLSFLMDERCCNLSKKTEGCDNMLEVLLISVHEVCGHGFSTDIERRLNHNLKKFYPAVHDRIRRLHSERGLQNLKFALDKCNKEGLLDPNADIELMAQMFLMTAGLYLSDNSLALPESITREEAFAVMTINFLRGLASVKGLQIIDQTLARDAKRRLQQGKEEN